MDEILERGLKGTHSSIADVCGGDRTSSHPRQFTLEDSRTRRRERSGETEEQIEPSSTPEEDWPRAGRPIAVEVTTAGGSARGAALSRELRDKGIVRRAFLLSEILDQPRALRPCQPAQRDYTE